MRAAVARHALLVTTLIAVSALLLAPQARGELTLGSWRAEGEVGIGGRTTWGDDDEGKFREYRDLEEGAVGEYRLLLREASGRYFFRSQGENPGYDDQRYWFEGGRYGRFKLEGFLRELPHVFSTRAATLYSRSGSASRLPAGLQGRVSGAASPSAQLQSELAAARPVALGLRWLEAGGGAELQWTDSVRLYGSYRLQDKDGTRARAIDWGTPGGNFAVFPLEVDERIHELRTGGEWLTGAGSLSLEYLGSFYQNELRRSLVDNPLVALDTTTAAARGQQALAPDNSAHSLALSGASALPLSFPARATGSLVYGLRLQDQSFLPHTVNPTLSSPGLALPRNDLDGRVHTLLANLRLDLDPHPDFGIDLRYRLYRYDNDSDEISFPEHVTNDGALVSSPRRSVANDYSVQRASAEGAYDLTSRTTLRAGYGWEYWQRSNDRQVEDLHEHGPTAKLDHRWSAGTSMHASYAFRTREGSSYHPYAHFDETLDAQGRAEARRFGESPGLRKFDQADRDTHRLDLQARTLYGERLELSLSGGFYQADYRDTNYGLKQHWSFNLGGDAYYQVHSRVGVRAFYDFESSAYEQDGRWRPRSFFVPPPGQIVAVDDPLNDWSSRTRSRFHTTGLVLDVALLPDRLDLELGYEFYYGRERTTSSGPAGFVAAAPPTTGGDGGNSADFPKIEEWLHAFTAAATLRVSDAVSIATQYRYEDYDLNDDFRRQGLGPFLGGSNVNGSGGVTPSTDIFLANDVNGYRAHILRLVTRIRF